MELAANALKWGDFTLASGAKSKYYINCKPVTLDGAGAYYAARCLLDLIPPHIRAIGGLTIGADPIVSAVSVAAHLQSRDIKGFLVRKEAKGHGTQSQIENMPPKSTPVVIVDDVITTGGSALKAAQVAKEAGLNVALALCLVDRLQGGEDAFRALGIPFGSIFTIDDFMK